MIPEERAPFAAGGGLAVAVDVLAFTVEKARLMVLLAKRRGQPFEGAWALPGGLVGAAESAEEAAERVFREKTGIGGVYMEQLYTFSAPDRDPRARSISVAYLALAPRTALQPALASPDVRLFPLQPEADRLFAPCPEDGAAPAALAFDHARMIRVALSRMAGKLEYADIGFHMLEDRRRFTLSELYDIYSAVSGKPYDLPNFRRAIKKRYEETGRIEPTGEKVRRRGAPAVIYRWKEEDAWKRY